jgi:Rieske Fe-S protein
MSSDDSKSAPQPTTSPSTSKQPVQQQPAPSPLPIKKPLISRRAFIVSALGVSVLLTAGSLAQSGNILAPLIPPSEDVVVAGSASTLEQEYQNALASKNSSNNVYVPVGYSDFFYFPYPVTASPYYKDIIVRLPDVVIPTSNSQILTVPQTINGTLYNSKFVAYNTTCVHLQCLVNPGYDPVSGEFRLQCPCHGSQYRMSDGVPVAGPAFDLGLNPLPQITIDYDKTTGYVRAINGQNGINGVPGVGRTS